MIDFGEDLLPLTQAVRHFPGPHAPHVGTVVRWGLKGVGKDRVKLETVKIGGRRYTSKQALLRFVTRLSGEAGARAALSERRARAIRKAEHELDAEGIS